jgi:TRAP-type mannitol/chloroaromatic compound transport system permease small subunit
VDPIWFGILIVCVVEIGLISPPVGMNLFVLSALLPERAHAHGIPRRDAVRLHRLRPFGNPDCLPYHFDLAPKSHDAQPDASPARLSRAIDALNEKLSRIADWLVLLSCMVSAGNAFSRYAFSISSNAWLEIRWYMFGTLVLLGASYTLKRNEHVRVDIVYSNLGTRAQIAIDIFGAILFLLPAMLIMTYLSWPIFYNSWAEHELSSNAGD